MSSTPWLSDRELRDLTRRRQPAAQARRLKDWGIPFERRADGTLLVGRTATETRLSGGIVAAPTSRASTGLNWSKST